MPIQSDHREHRLKQRGYEALKVSLRQSAIQRKHRYKKVKAHFGKLENWISFITLIFVAFYTVLTFFQWLAFRDQESRQLRAYMVFKNPIIQTNGARAQDGELIWNIGTRIKNSGQTPAVGVRTLGSIGVIPREANFIDISVLDKYGPNQSQTNVGSGEESGGAFFVVSANLFIAASENIKRIAVAGEVTYQDVFEKKHVTKYCYFLGFPAGFDPNIYSRTRKPEGTIEFCPIGNCIDNECEGQSSKAPLPDLGPIAPPPAESHESTPAP